MNNYASTNDQIVSIKYQRLTLCRCIRRILHSHQVALVKCCDLNWKLRIATYTTNLNRDVV